MRYSRRLIGVGFLTGLLTILVILLDRRSSSRGWKKFAPLETIRNPAASLLHDGALRIRCCVEVQCKSSHGTSNTGVDESLTSKSTRYRALITVYLLFDTSLFFLLIEIYFYLHERTCGKSYKASTIVIYDSRVVPDLKIPHITTLES